MVWSFRQAILSTPVFFSHNALRQPCIRPAVWLGSEQRSPNPSGCGASGRNWGKRPRVLKEKDSTAVKTVGEMESNVHHIVQEQNWTSSAESRLMGTVRVSSILMYRKAKCISCTCTCHLPFIIFYEKVSLKSYLTRLRHHNIVQREHLLFQNYRDTTCSSGGGNLLDFLWLILLCSYVCLTGNIDCCLYHLSGGLGECD